MANYPIVGAGDGPWNEGAHVPLFQARNKKVPSGGRNSIVLALIFQKWIENPTPPLDQTPVTKNVLLPARTDSVVFTTAREEVLVLRTAEEVDDGDNVFASSMLDEVGYEGRADLADGGRASSRQLEKMEVTGRIGLGDEQDGLEGCRKDEHLNGEGDNLFCCRLGRLGLVSARGRPLDSTSDGGFDREGEEVLFAVCLVGFLSRRSCVESIGAGGWCR